MDPASESGPGSPEALLLRYRERRDPAAFAALFDAAAGPLYRVAVVLLPDPASAEDALQETFLALLDVAHRYDPRRPAWPWLLGILRKKALEIRRRDARTPEPIRVRLPLGPPEPPDAAASVEERERVRAALLGLPEPYRTVSLLRWRHGLTPAEIAELRGEAPATTRSTLRRALARLRRGLGRLSSLALLLPAGPSRRGFAAVRRVVLAHAAASAGAVITGATAGGVVMMKKTLLAVIVLGALALSVRHVLAPAPPVAPPAATTASDAPPPPRDRTAPATATAPGGAPADATPRGDARVACLVRAAATGAPVPGARVTLRLRPQALEEPGSPDPVAEAATGEDGRAAVGGLPAGRYGVEAVANGYARARVDASLTAGTTASVEVVLRAGHVLAGRVLDAGGNPVGGALVLASAPGTSESATADADGAYRLERLPPGEVELHAARPGGATTAVGTVRVPGVARFDLVLPEEGALAGTVREAGRGRPVPGIVVTATPLPAAGRPASGTTGKDGVYRLTLPAGRVRVLSAGKPGWGRARKPGAPESAAVPAGGTAVLDLVVAPTGSLAGTVTGPEGPVAGAAVTLTRRGEAARRVRTGADGTWRADDLPAGTVGIRAELADHFDTAFFATGAGPAGTVEVRPGKTTRHDLRLARGVAVVGVVTDESGIGLAGVEVAPRLRAFPSVRSGPAGEFRIGGLPPRDEVELIATASGRTQAEPVRVAVRTGESTDRVVIRMVRLARVLVRVTTETGAPAGEAAAAIVALPAEALPEIREWILWQGAADRVVGPDGAVELVVPADAARFRVRVRGPGFAEAISPAIAAEAGRDSYSVDVVLREGIRLSGRVVRAGSREGLAGARVRLGPAGGGYGVPPVLAVTGADGTFSLEAVSDEHGWHGSFRNGTVEVAATAPGHRPASVRVPATAGAPLLIELAPAAAISGRVVFAGGAPAPGLRVRAIPAGADRLRMLRSGSVPARSETRTGSDGAFEVRGIAPGRYRLEVAGSPPVVARSGGETVAAGATGVEIVVDAAPPGAAFAERFADELFDSARAARSAGDVEGSAARFGALLDRRLTRTERVEALTGLAITMGRAEERRAGVARVREALLLADVATERDLAAAWALVWSAISLDVGPEAMDLARRMEGARAVSEVWSAFGAYAVARLTEMQGDAPNARRMLEALRERIRGEEHRYGTLAALIAQALAEPEAPK